MIKPNNYYRDKAIEKYMGQVNVGDIVACRSHKLAHTLIDIVGDIGVCKLPDGEINHFPVTELFNVNIVAKSAYIAKITDGLIIDRNN